MNTLRSMNRLRAAAALLLGALACLGPGAAEADRGHWRGHVGVGVVVDPFWFGAPYPGPYYYPYPGYYPYYYPPPVVAVPPEPPVYIERDAIPEPAPEAYWYYCTRPRGYYPQVKKCPGGWQPVPPQPPSDEER